MTVDWSCGSTLHRQSLKIDVAVAVIHDAEGPQVSIVINDAGAAPCVMISGVEGRRQSDSTCLYTIECAMCSCDAAPKISSLCISGDMSCRTQCARDRAGTPAIGLTVYFGSEDVGK